MDKRLDTKRILVFLLFAFGIAWAGGLVIFLTGGLANSPLVGGKLPLAIVILTIVYMGAPAVAHLLTRLITREGWRDLYLRPQLSRGWPYWIIAWLAPGVCIFLGMAVYLALFPQYYDASLSMVTRLVQTNAAAQSARIDPWTVVITQTVAAVILAPILNAFPILGEEFGWRAYLQPKLMPLGGRKAVLLTGAIWGVWHWPIIAMGYNYGQGYVGAPWLGLIAMVWFTVIFGALLGWMTLRAGSVWPAVIGHGALNGLAGIVVFFVQGQPNLLLGPTVAGVIGSIGFAVIALILFIVPAALQAPGAKAASAVEPVQLQGTLDLRTRK